MLKNLLAPAENRTQTIFKRLFLITAVLLFVVRPFLSFDYGPCSDEFYHKPIGELAYNYITSFGADDSVFHYKANDRDDPALLLNYGPIVDVTATAVYRALGTDIYYTRHVIITLFTFLFFLYAGLCGKRLGGWRAGFFALLFAIICPRIWGEAFNNPKDPTFAAFYIMSLYYIMAFADELPKPGWKTTLKLMVALGFAFGIRVGALLLFFYLALALFFDIMANKEYRKALFGFQASFLKGLLLPLVVALAGAWVIGIATWPSALQHPISHPFVALGVFSKFPTIIRTVFEGKSIGSNEVPWYYTPYYILITTPFITLLGVAIGVVLLPFMRKIYNFRRVLLIIFSFAFPLFYIAYSKAPLYNGWRHSYFVFGGIAVFSGLGFEALIRYFSAKWSAAAVTGVVALGALFPIVFMIRSHPLQYVYINELAGGVEGTYGEYQLDYYAHSAMPAARWFAKNVPFDSTKIVISNNPYELNEAWKSMGSRWGADYVRFRERYDKNWDYGIFLPQYVDVNMFANDHYVQKGTIHEIKVGNSTIAFIMKRENKNDFLGKQAFDQKDLPRALTLLADAVRYNPDNEIAQANYGIALLTAGQAQAAVAALEKATTISPASFNAKFALGYAYLQVNNVDAAIRTFEQLIEENPGFPEPYRVLAEIYAQKGNMGAAQQYMSNYQQLTQGQGQ